MGRRQGFVSSAEECWKGATTYRDSKPCLSSAHVAEAATGDHHQDAIRTEAANSSPSPQGLAGYEVPLEGPSRHGTVGFWLTASETSGLWHGLQPEVRVIATRVFSHSVVRMQ